MLRSIVSAAFFFATIASVTAIRGQTADPHPPHAFTVNCPDSTREGEAIEFSVKYRDERDRIPASWMWFVSSGTVLEGQGTQSIRVRAPSGSVTATVVRDAADRDLVGLQVEGTCTTMVTQVPEASKDEFSTARTSCESVFAQLDNYMAALAADPSARGLILIGRDAVNEKAALYQRLNISNYLKWRHSDASRISVMLAPPLSNAQTQLWLIPPGAADPGVAANGQAVATEYVLTSSKLPFEFANDAADVVEGCSGNIFDLESFAKYVAATSGARARVIVAGTNKEFGTRSREILGTLVAAGLAKNRISFIRRPPRAGVGAKTELWVTR